KHRFLLDDPPHVIIKLPFFSAQFDGNQLPRAVERTARHFRANRDTSPNHKAGAREEKTTRHQPATWRTKHRGLLFSSGKSSIMSNLISLFRQSANVELFTPTRARRLFTQFGSRNTAARRKKSSKFRADRQ